MLGLLINIEHVSIGRKRSSSYEIGTIPEFAWIEGKQKSHSWYPNFGLRFEPVAGRIRTEVPSVRPQRSVWR